MLSYEQIYKDRQFDGRIQPVYYLPDLIMKYHAIYILPLENGTQIVCIVKITTQWYKGVIATLDFDLE